MYRLKQTRNITTKTLIFVLVEITNKMQPCNRIYYSTVHWRLNMFRAAYRFSSGAPTVFAASGLHTHVVTGRSQVWVGYFYWVILRCMDQWILKIPSLKSIGNSVKKNYNECGVLWDNKPCLFFHDILAEEGWVQNYIFVLWFEKLSNSVCRIYNFSATQYAVHYLVITLLTGDNGICIQKQILAPSLLWAEARTVKTDRIRRR